MTDKEIKEWVEAGCGCWMMVLMLALTLFVLAGVFAAVKYAVGI